MLVVLSHASGLICTHGCRTCHVPPQRAGSACLECLDGQDLHGQPHMTVMKEHSMGQMLIENMLIMTLEIEDTRKIISSMWLSTEL